jgi:hypothetical protein
LGDFCVRLFLRSQICIFKKIYINKTLTKSTPKTIRNKKKTKHKYVVFIAFPHLTILEFGTRAKGWIVEERSKQARGVNGGK